LTWGKYNDQTPETSDRGIYFSSDREGVYNLFLLDAGGRITRQSEYATGAFDPRVTPDGRRLVYTGYEDFQFRIYQMKLSDTTVAVANLAGLGHSAWAPRQTDRLFGKSSVKYKTITSC
jgi:Tol biopolymer transport system component